MDLDDLRRLITEDLAEGKRPIAVIGDGGNSEYGCDRRFGRLGGPVRGVSGFGSMSTAPSGRWRPFRQPCGPIVAGLERADSVAFDLHKWMYLPFEIACLLVRDGEAHRATFSQSASYLAMTERGVNATGHRFAEFGLELTRALRH